ncbi:unnamed protein product, partial [marine sediment metagenome]
LIKLLSILEVNDKKISTYLNGHMVNFLSKIINFIV